MQPIPNADDTARGKAGCKFHCQWPMAAAGDILAQLLLVRREDADATSPARNGHIPLLRVRRGLDGRIGKQDVIRGVSRNADLTARACASRIRSSLPRKPARETDFGGENVKS